jgi:RNA polymerase sigma factor (sigma-70 family)
VPHEHREATLHHLQTLFDVGVVTGLTDGELLEQFARRHGEAAEVAFAALVERHGSMVLRVCRGIVGNDQDAQDAFQATFFILARKGNSLWVRDSLAPWLHRVACRAAARLKVSTNRQRAIERRAAEVAVEQTKFECQEDWGQTLHEEVDRLPQYYRLPVVLCDLEGHSYEAASRYLGCPIGTIKSRLARGRERLRHRLVRRGLAPSAGIAILPALMPEAIPAALCRSTIQSVVRIKPGMDATAGAFSTSVITLSEGVLKAMLLTKIRTAFAVTLVAGVAVTGLGLLVSGTTEAQNQTRQQPEPSKVESSVASPSQAAKSVSTKVAKAKSASQRERDPFESPARVIALGHLKKIWAFAPETETWHTYKAPEGVTVESHISSAGDFVALKVSGEPITEVAVFSIMIGKWSRQALLEPATTREVTPILGNDFTVYFIGRRVYAFSAVTGTWSQQTLEIGSLAPSMYNGSSCAIYHDSRGLHAFSSLTGTWETMEVEKGAQARIERGPSNTVLIVNGSRLYSFAPNHAHFEEIKADED